MSLGCTMIIEIFGACPSLNGLSRGRQHLGIFAEQWFFLN